MNTVKRFPKYRLSPAPALAFAVLLAGFITLLALWCQPNALRTVLAGFKAQPLLIVLNALPVGLLLLTLTCLLNNVFFSGALVNLAVCGLSIANRVKIEVRDESVFPRDLALIKEVGSIVGEYELQYPVKVMAVVLAVTVALAVLGVFVSCRPVSFAAVKARLTRRDAVGVLSRGRCWPERLLGAAVSFGALAGLILTVYASNPLYNSFRVSNAYYVPAVFNELGFPYCFCHQFTTYPVDRPEGFSKAEAEGWETAYRETLGTAEPEPVSVIFVMNEAFSDITDAAAFTYAEDEDPLPNLHALRQDPNCVSGHIVVPGFAAGTANTEFDVLTGIQTNALSATTTSAMRVVNRDLDSLFRVYGARGYRTSYFHPGDDWFYNRENVLAWMGAETTRFVDEMENLDYKGRWVTDDCLVDQIEAEFEAALAEGRPLFHYMTTIQNHMSYTADKYGPDYVFPEVPLDRSVSDTTETLLSVYIEGARDADAMLGRLVEDLSARSEPVVLVFFGDHLPYLGDNQLGYTELGLTETAHWAELGSYETPYVIWANDAAAEALDWEKAVSALELPEDGTLSAAFLGAAALELTGADTESGWFSFLNTLRRELPVVQKNTAVLAEGSVADLYDQSPALLDQWRKWSYYKLKYQEFD